MAELKVELENIRNVEIKSKVVTVKDQDPRVVTSVRFEYDGEPSEIEPILMLEAQGQPINTTMGTPQLALAMDN
jgi:hypothetical protein